MSRQLRVCASCRCHVRVGECVCPHCGVDFAMPGAVREPQRRSIVVRRVLVATAMAGFGATGCGGGQEAKIDIMGSCVPPSSASPVVPCASGFCACGPGGVCKNDQCVASCNCAANEGCDSAGICQPQHWYFGRLPTAANGCYGSPPPLA